uniref:Elongator complex protein 5 n=1 Tax=Tabanus bromius TaxID=304241 RepID=A0A0K8TR53_TABBR
MISNIVVSQQKFVLFVDKIGFESASEQVIKSWLGEQKRNSFFVLPDRSAEEIDFSMKKETCKIPKLNQQTDVILQPLSQLLLSYNASSVFQLVNKLKKTQNVRQIFLWATVRNISEHFVVPFLQYMSDMTVTFSDFRNLSILMRKPGGLVTSKSYVLELVDGVFNVTEFKKGVKSKPEPIVNPESLGTFKINLDEEEQVVRNALKLPYERNAQNGGDIIYTPDADDDFDEEDPDEDLYI